MCSADIFLGVLAILFPPLPVWVKCGICSADSLINILLCILGFIPGLLHSWYIIAKFPEPAYEYESLPQHDNRQQGGRVAYVYVETPPRRQAPPKAQGAPPNSTGMNYGTQGGSSRQATMPQEQGVANNGQGSSDHQGVPPSYADVVAGDHKVQSHD